jgi:hypothetical protein
MAPKPDDVAPCAADLHILLPGPLPAAFPPLLC